MPTVKFDWTINAGHVLQAVVLFVGIIAAVTAIRTKLSELDARTAGYPATALLVDRIDQRTADYQQTRDQVKANEATIKALTTLASDAGATNRAMLQTLGDVQQQVAGMKATLEAMRSQQRTELSPLRPSNLGMNDERTTVDP